MAEVAAQEDDIPEWEALARAARLAVRHFRTDEFEIQQEYWS